MSASAARRRRALATLLGILALAPSADASHCVRYDDVNLNLLIDYSGSMAGAKHEMARDFALRVIDGLAGVGRLRRAGGIGFPIIIDARTGAVVNGFNLGVTEDVATLRDRVAGAPAPTGGWTPLYHAIVTGSGYLQDLSVPGMKILVVISDGVHTNPAAGPPMPRSEAVRALAALEGWKYLVYFGEAPPAPCASFADEGARDLCLLGSETGSEFRIAGLGAERELAEVVLAQACRNHAPSVSVNGPAFLRLGEGGRFTATFDASATRDAETPFADLDFAWRVTPLTGSGTPRTGGGRGAAGAVDIETFTEADIGTWEIRLEVADSADGRHEWITPVPFEVVGSPPVLDLQGGGTIDVLQEMAVRTTVVDDVDGGTLTFDWELVAGPPAGRHPLGSHWTTAAIPPWTTAEADITVLSDRATRRTVADGASIPPIPPWLFRLTAQDNEMQTAMGEISVDVANLAPEPRVEAPALVAAGDPIDLAAAGTDDPDGGPVSLVWDVIQAPNSDPEGGARLDASHSSTWTLPTDERHAGTWIFRLGVTDNEGESVEPDDQVVLVDAPPEIAIEGDTEILSLTGALDLDANGSVDPDTDTDHTNLEGEAVLSPGIVRWTWSLVDVPIEQVGTREGGVADALRVAGRGPTLHLDPGTLPPGAWTLQLEVEDGERNVASEQVRVSVIDEESRPVAIASAPRRYTLDLLSRPAEAVMVSGAGSFDPDDVPAGRSGVDAYRWEVVSAPCADRSPAAAATWEIFPAGIAIPARCHGAWLLRLTVTDNDVPTPRTDTATTEVVVSTCPDPVCIDYPTGSPPAMADLSAPIDIPIFYHLDSALYSDPAFRFGLIARLDIFHRDTGTLAHTAWDPEVMPAPAGPGLQFRWTGGRGLFPPRRGVYDVAVSLVDSTLGTLFTARKERAIVISGADPVFDCGNLWAGGFPDGRDGGAFPCVTFEDPFAIPPVPVRVRYSPGWETADPFNAELLIWTLQAAREAWITLSALGAMPELEVILSDRPPPDPTEEDDALAVAYAGYVDPGEPCPIIVYPLGIALDRGPFQQTVAHEVAHCFQYRNWNVDYTVEADEWWTEGTAEFLSNVVYPEEDYEHRRIETLSSRVAIYQQSYASAAFFQSLANHPRFGVEGVIRLMGALATEAGRMDPAAVLAAQLGMADAFHAYGEQLHGVGTGVDWSGIADTGVGYWPRRTHQEDTAFLYGDRIEVPPWAATMHLEGDTVVMPAASFTPRLYFLQLQNGFIYRVRLETRGGAHSSAATGFLPRAWGALPAELRPPCRVADAGEGDFWQIVVSNATATAGDHELRMTVSRESNPACR